MARFGLIFLSFLFIAPLQANAFCFIAKEKDRLLIEQGDCESQYSPCSTFKIAISLMGFDAGILKSTLEPLWEYQESYDDSFEAWKQPHNPSLWMKHSCVWYSQLITQQLQNGDFDQYVKEFEYGNQDLSGDAGLNNGLTHAWLSSSLKISAKEQVVFLNKLIEDKLPVSLDAHTLTKKLLFYQELNHGWKLYAKTGKGPQVDEKGHKIKDRQLGWFVGFIQKNDRAISFAYLIIDSEAQSTFASVRAKNACKMHIEEWLSNPDF